MNTQEIKQLLTTEPYDFLRTNEHLGDNIILLTLGGSHAYGTNNENSDVDVRGIALERPSDLIGFTEFEQVTDTATDTVVYAFNKIIKLFLNSNPNTIEMLGCKPEHYLYLSDIGQQLIDNRKLFISQKCIGSFIGYANSQLNRLSNSIARDSNNKTKQEESMLKSLENTLMHFSNHYEKFDDNSIEIYIADSYKEDMEKEIYVNMSLKNYPLRDATGILSEMSNVIRQYGKVNHRNKKKDDNHLAKHMMHLLRLYLMGIDLLEKEEIITYRGDDLDLLLPVRNGKYLTETSDCTPEFDELLQDLEKRFKYAVANTSLQKEPDTQKVQEFVMEVNKKIVEGR